MTVSVFLIGSQRCNEGVGGRIVIIIIDWDLESGRIFGAVLFDSNNIGPHIPGCDTPLPLSKISVLSLFAISTCAIFLVLVRGFLVSCLIKSIFFWFLGFIWFIA